MKSYAAETDGGRLVRETILKLKVINAILLTVMNDIDGSTRSENGEATGIVEAGSVFGDILDLELDTDH